MIEDNDSADIESAPELDSDNNDAIYQLDVEILTDDDEQESDSE